MRACHLPESVIGQVEPPGRQARPGDFVSGEIALEARELEGAAFEHAIIFIAGPDTLFVAYYASAEIGCHLALDWEIPVNILDLYVEFRNLTNGLPTPCGVGLLGAMSYFGLGVATLDRSGLALEAAAMLAVREKVMALVPSVKAARLETDHEALLEAQGLAARPGPRQRIDRKIAAVIAEAVKAFRILEVEYQSRGEPAPRVSRSPFQSQPIEV